MHGSLAHFCLTVGYEALQSKGKRQHTTQQLLPSLRKASGGTASSQIFSFLPTAWEAVCVVASSTQQQGVSNDSVLPILILLMLSVDVCAGKTQASPPVL